VQNATVTREVEYWTEDWCKKNALKSSESTNPEINDKNQKEKYYAE